MHELRLLDIQKKYKDKEAVRKFNYTFTNGVYGLLGENGAGKTTLMRLICGVLQPTGGSIYCDNIEIVSMGAEYRKLLGYLPQDFGYYGDFTAERFLRYMAALKALPEDYANSRIDELLDMVELKNVKKKKKDDTTTNQLDPYSTYNISLNQNIASTYASLAESNNVRNLVASSLKVSAAELGTIKTTVREDIAEFIVITVINKSPEMAQKVVKKIPSAFNEELIRLMGIDCVQVVYEASDPALIERGKDLTILKAAGVGVVLSIFLVLLAECLDTKIVTPDDINKYWNYQLIGTIPLDRSNSKGKRRTKK